MSKLVTTVMICRLLSNVFYYLLHHLIYNTVVRGYREVHRELSVARSNWEQQQERARRSASQERAPPATFYKSVVGTR